MAVASLVFGIISIVIGVIGSGFQWIGVILAILGIIFGSANSNPEKAGLAKAGKVCSIIGLVLCIILFVACVACASAIGGTLGVFG